MAEPDEQADEDRFRSWLAQLKTLEVDGEKLFIVHGDELKDEAQVRVLWENLQKPQPGPAAKPAGPLEFLDIPVEPEEPDPEKKKPYQT